MQTTAKIGVPSTSLGSTETPYQQFDETLNQSSIEEHNDQTNSSETILSLTQKEAQQLIETPEKNTTDANNIQIDNSKPTTKSNRASSDSANPIKTPEMSTRNPIDTQVPTAESDLSSPVNPTEIHEEQLPTGSVMNDHVCYKDAIIKKVN